MLIFSEAPAWLGAILGSSITAVGLIAVGFMKARTAQKKMDMGGVGTWAALLVARVESLEKQLADERRYCDERIKDLRRQHVEEVAARQAVIHCLETKVDQLRQELQAVARARAGSA